MIPELAARIAAIDNKDGGEVGQHEYCDVECYVHLIHRTDKNTKESILPGPFNRLVLPHDRTPFREVLPVFGTGLDAFGLAFGIKPGHV